MKRSSAATLFLLSCINQTTVTFASDISASCKNCVQSLAKPVVYGCTVNEPLYLTFNDTKLPCGSAITLEQGKASPKVYYTDAKDDALYSILLIDTTGKDPSEGLQPPFADYPLVLYGALDVPGRLLKDGMSMEKYVREGNGTIVATAFQEYQPADPPTPQEVPGIETFDISIVPFNYELMLGEQLREAGKNEPPNYDSPIRFDFYYVTQKIAPLNNVHSYYSSGACVVAVDVGSEVPCDVRTEKGELAYDFESWRSSMAAVTGVTPAGAAGGATSPAPLHKTNVLIVSSVSLAALVFSVTS